MHPAIRRLATLPLLAFAAPALAHPGHIVEDSGHGHWIALLAAGSAIVILGVAVARSRTRARKLKAAGPAE